MFEIRVPCWGYNFIEKVKNAMIYEKECNIIIILYDFQLLINIIDAILKTTNVS